MRTKKKFISKYEGFTRKQFIQDIKDFINDSDEKLGKLDPKKLTNKMCQYLADDYSEIRKATSKWDEIADGDYEAISELIKQYPQILKILKK